jgi:glyoxylase-like metal-dependent hydrolase (beta-lactamase superfamily II)
MKPLVKPLFDSNTKTFSYVVYDAPNGKAAIIDSVLDFEAASASTHTQSADAIVRFVQEQALTVEWILETHAHADHLSAAPYLKRALGGKIGIGVGIKTVQKVFKGIYNLGPEMRADGEQFDRLFSDGDAFALGALRGEVIAVPGHTPADVAYKIGDALFVGDTLFMPDVGTARCDFPGGDASVLYDSVRKLLAHQSDSRIFVCHDYPPTQASAAARAPRWETSVAEQRAHNIHVRDGVSKAQFVEMRTARDATLAMPALMLPSVQVNIQAGNLPREESNGVPYLKIPVNLKL